MTKRTSSFVAAMTETAAAAFLRLVESRRGHFRLESGHHGAFWLDLDTLFASPARIAPFVSDLAGRVRRHDVSAVCGPLLGGAFLAQQLAVALDVEFWFTERVPPSDRSGLYGASYVLPPAFTTRVPGRRVAIVDDVMSAGSALRGTFTELRAHRARPVVAAALLVLGDAGADFFAEQQLPVEWVARDEYELWLPEACPMCASDVPLEDSSASLEHGQ